MNFIAYKRKDVRPSIETRVQAVLTIANAIFPKNFPSIKKKGKNMKRKKKKWKPKSSEQLNTLVMGYFSLFVKIADISKWSYSCFWMTWSVTQCSLLAVVIMLWYWSQCCCYAVWWRKKPRGFFQSADFLFIFFLGKPDFPMSLVNQFLTDNILSLFILTALILTARLLSYSLSYYRLLQKPLWFYLVRFIWSTSLLKSKKKVM